MAKKIISYKINQDGTIPDYVEDGGYLPNHPNSLSNAVFLGISKDGADISKAQAVFNDEASAIAYVNTYMSGLVVASPTTKEERVFDFAPVVSIMFAKIA